MCNGWSIRNSFIAVLMGLSQVSIAQQAVPATDVKEVKVGEQTWMTDNLKVPVAGSFAYKNDVENVRGYGRLYTWDAAMKACPKGWHLPSDAEWTQLSNYLGGVAYASTKLKAGGPTGFNAVMSGFRHETGEFEAKNTDALFWTSTPYEKGTAWVWQIKSFSPKLLQANYPKGVAASCRCLKDAEVQAAGITMPAIAPATLPAPAPKKE